MKNVFLTNKLVKTLVIILVLMTIFYFAIPNYVSAGWGGVLLEPVKDLILAIGDGIVYVMNWGIYNINASAVYIDNRAGNTIIPWVVGIAVGAVLIAVGGVLAIGVGGAIVGGIAAGLLTASYMPEEFYIPYTLISPQEIFANQVHLLDVNFFNPGEYEKNPGEYKDAEGNEYTSIAGLLRGTVSKWYYTMVTIAAIGFMCILLYIAFKIIITSNTEEKAKYKERIKDWVVGLCLLATMHYIMVFSVSIVESITKALYTNLDVVVVEIPTEGLKKGVKEEIIAVATGKESGEVTGSETITTGEGPTSIDGGDVINFPTTLLGKARIEAQLGDTINTEPEGNTEEATGTEGTTGESLDWASVHANQWQGQGVSVEERYKESQARSDTALLHNFSFTLVYIILVIYTVIFLFIYLKRVFYMALLTILAPLVAMYYPIDKITDGQAQGFNTWLKEYVFNLLMQPFHLILYTMLVGSAMDLAVRSPVYAIIAIGFMMPAERLIRQLFQLKNAANTTGESGSMVGTLVGLSMLKPFTGVLGSGKSSSSNSTGKVRTAGNGAAGALASGSDSGGGTGDNLGGAPGNNSGGIITNMMLKGGDNKKGKGLTAEGAKLQELAKIGGKKAVKAGKSVGKLGVAAIGGATGIVMGAAAGIASGKPADAAKYAAAAGGAGAKLGTTAINGIKNIGDGGQKLYNGLKDEYLEKAYGTTNENDIRYIKENADIYNDRYGNNAYERMQEGLILNRAGLEGEEIHQAIKLQSGEIGYYEKQLKEETVQDYDNITDDGQIPNKKIVTGLENKKGTEKKIKMNRQDSINYVRKSKESKAVLEDPEREVELYQEMIKSYQNQGLNDEASNRKASEELAARRFINGLDTK